MTETAKTAEEHFADAVLAAKAAFAARATALGDPQWQDIAADAYENTFSVEVFGEYSSDLERWQVALATLDMLADERGL